MEDASNFYFFVVDHAQQFTLLDISNGRTELVGPKVHSAIRVGPGEPNTLGVLVIGDYIELYVNQQLVGVTVDSTHQLGGARPASYTFVDSDSPVHMAFDDFAYLPLQVNSPALLDDRPITAIATTTAATAIRARPQASAEVLLNFSPNQPVTALARTADSAYIYGYARGVTGWYDAANVTLAQDSAPLAVEALPMLDAAAQGERVGVWPVVWPDEATSTEPPDPAVAVIAYGQTVRDTLAEEGAPVVRTFNGQAGEVVTITTSTEDNPALDTYLTLLGPDSDDLLVEDDDSGPGLNAMIDGFELPLSGWYTIRVDGIAGAGDFTLTLTR